MAFIEWLGQESFYLLSEMSSEGEEEREIFVQSTYNNLFQYSWNIYLYIYFSIYAISF